MEFLRIIINILAFLGGCVIGYFLGELLGEFLIKIFKKFGWW